MISLPTQAVTASPFTVQLPITDPELWSAVVLQNESAYNLTVSYGATQKLIAAWNAEVIFLDGQNTSFRVTTALNLPNAQQPNNTLSMQLYSATERQPNAAQYPMELSRMTQAYGQSDKLATFQCLVANNPNTTTLTLKPSTTALLIASTCGAAYPNNGFGTGYVEVVGNTTGTYYEHLTGSQFGVSLVVPVAPGADSQVVINASVANNLSLIILELTYPATSLPLPIIGGPITGPNSDGSFPITQDNGITKVGSATVANGGTVLATPTIGYYIWGVALSSGAGGALDTGLIAGIPAQVCKGTLLVWTMLPTPLFWPHSSGAVIYSAVAVNQNATGYVLYSGS